MADRQEIRSIASRLKEERARLKMTQPSVAEAGGVSKTTVVGYEAGTHPPDAVFLSRLVARDLDLSYVVTGERAAVRAGSSLDWELFEDVLEVVETFEERRGRKLPVKNKTRILRILYCSSIAGGRVDAGFAAAVFAEAA